MSIKKKLPLIFCLIVFFTLLTNNALHFARTKQQLLNANESEIRVIIKHISFQIENTKGGTLYVEDILGRDLRIASIAIEKALPPKYENVTNEQLVKLAKELRVSDITLLAKTKNDIIGVRSSDPHEIHMSTNGWGYWYDAFKQLFSLKPVTVKKGLSLPYYWSGPVEIASSNPHDIDKWGYYYDGSTDYIINPYFRDKAVLGYENKFGPSKIIQDATKERGVLEITVFNPKNFGKKDEEVNLNGHVFTRISEKPVWYGTYNYQNVNKDSNLIHKALKTDKELSYKTELNNKMVMKTFVPVISDGQQPYVIGLVYNYGLIEHELSNELMAHILLSIMIMIAVLVISFIFSRSITKPIGYIVEHVNEIAKGKFGRTLQLNRRDELGLLTENVNALSKDLRQYVDDLQHSKELIEYQAYHDPLTGLLNRRYFQEKLKPLLNDPLQSNQTVSVLFVDLDRFKHVNDSFGHSKGDELLKIAAERIIDCLPPQSEPIIMRQGGDEFIIVLKNLDMSETKQIAEKIVGTIKNPYCLEGNELYIGASCGISLLPTHTKDFDKLIIYADMAMYTAKKLGGNKVIIFNDEISRINQERPRLETRLRKAIEQGKVEVFYQPKVDGRSGVIFGAEALLRWNDEDYGFVSPEKFISIAEESGLIQPLWEFVMKTACHDFGEWNLRRLEPLNISVNFSARQFQEPANMVLKVKEILYESKLDPKNFEIEITESILLNNSEEIIDALNALKDLGISISIDDFGTGYSSLNYLRNLPINSLKIDKSFVQDINENHDNTEIVEAIINLARSLHLNVIAEGVEKEYQRNFLLTKSCVQMQGFLFAEPLAKKEFDHYLST